MFEIVVLIAVVVAVTELVKKMELFEVNYLPFISLLLGLVIGLVYLDYSIKENLMYGMMIGLSASGLFDQSKIIKK